MGFLLIIIISLICLVPWFLKNRVLLLLWFVLVSVFLISVTFWAMLNVGDAPAAAGGVMILAGILFVLSLLFCTIKGLMIYKSKDGTIKALPKHFLKGTLGVIVIIAMTLIVVAIGLWIIIAVIS